MASPGIGERRRLDRELVALARRGARGGRIEPHRAMLRLPNAGRRLALATALALAGLAGVLAALPVIGALWGWIARTADARLGLPGEVLLEPRSLFGLIEFAIPTLGAAGALPDGRSVVVAGLLAAILVVASLPLRGRSLPFGYFLRAVALVQVSAVIYFGLWPDRFPYRLPEYVVGHLEAGLVLMGLVPLVLGFTYYLFDVSLVRKVALTVMVLGHLAVFLPLQAILNAALVAHFTLVALPVLFLVFGLLLDVMIFVAFYGWAMSWPSSLWEEPARP